MIKLATSYSSKAEMSKDELIRRLMDVELAACSYLQYVIDKYRLENLPDDLYCEQIKNLYLVLMKEK